MKYLIVGLGNIGPEYEDTRHNIGFMVVDALARKAEAKFEIGRLAYHTQIRHKGRQITLIKPTTYMNLSGKAVNYWMKELKIEPAQVLVIVDDLALPLETLRMRGSGSAAGHNGLKDIEATLGTQQYPRLRFGIGSDFGRGKQVDYVLGRFTEDEMAALGTLIPRACDMVLSFCTQGIQATMNQYNK